MENKKENNKKKLRKREGSLKKKLETNDSEKEFESVLTEKNKLFVENYVFHFRLNGRKAYLETYPDANEKSANAAASRLLAKASIREYRDKLIQDAISSKKNELQYLFVEINRELVSATLSDYIDDAGNVDIEKIKTLHPAAVKEITTRRTFTKSGDEIVDRTFRLADKTKSLEMLGKYTGMYKDKEGSDVHIHFGTEESGL
ncbi:terminase small subunit [Leptospira alexanderi]|uniref:terminase small subunit n=1 Tax=Leptospira alexanderi TaxID=100053 RepID=UPI0009910CDF|nr:terminase small subunit [Leptospira alexanderi]